jgi:hypothetical protein
MIIKIATQNMDIARGVESTIKKENFSKRENFFERLEKTKDKD